MLYEVITVAEINLNEIVYISCNPSTFARDVGILESHGYYLKEVQPVDMFPQTSRITSYNVCYTKLLRKLVWR